MESDKPTKEQVSTRKGKEDRRDDLPSRDYNRGNYPSSKQRGFADINWKAVISIGGLLANLIVPAILYWYSVEFETRFNKAIEPIQSSIQTQLDYIKRDYGKIETKQSEHEQRVRDLEIRAGGKK